MNPPAPRSTDDMSNLGAWLSAGISHLTGHAIAYVIGAVVGGVGVFASLIVATACFGACVLFGGILSAVVGSEAPTVLAMVLGSFVALCALMVCMAPIGLGMHRGVLAVQRGEVFDAKVFTDAIADIPSVVAIGLVTGTLSLVGTMFCIAPGWIVGGLFLFAMPHYAHAGGGAMAALSKSIELAKPRLLPVVLYAVVLNFVISAVASVPMIGVFLVLPVHAVLSVSAYLAVIGEPPLSGK